LDAISEGMDLDDELLMDVKDGLARIIEAIDRRTYLPDSN